MASVCGLLNWRNTCPFGELSGAFPVDSIATISRKIVNFSANAPVKVIAYTRKNQAKSDHFFML